MVGCASNALRSCGQQKKIPETTVSNREAEIMKDVDIRIKEKIASTVRYKSYGQMKVKGIDEGGDGEMRVLGFFTDDNEDELGDIITKEATEKAVEKWRKWGNIRTMHQYPSGRVERVGSGDGLAWNEIETVPVDEQTQKLIDGGVLKAYSVGIIPREYELNEDALEGHEDDWWFFPLIIHDYDMIEISYVDHPANYSATINDVTIGKSREAFEHRAVLFKNREIIGDGDMDKDKEALEEEQPEEEVEEKALEQGQPDPEPEPEVEKDVEPTPEPEVEKEAGPDDAAPEEDVQAVEKDIDDSDEEEPVEKDVSEEDSEFDVELAVRDLNKQIADLESFVHGELATLVVDKVLEALATATETEEPESVKDVEANEEPADDDADEGIEKLASLVEDIVKQQLESFTDDIVEAVSFTGRKAKVARGEDDDEEENRDAVEDYMKMSGPERRKKLVGLLDEIYSLE